MNLASSSKIRKGQDFYSKNLMFSYIINIYIYIIVR
jgi:hypothetical protein